MTLIILGPATEDKVVIGENEEFKVGGASYFQSYVFESFNIDYIAIVNLKKDGLIDSFPDKNKVIPLIKEDTHFFVNYYPDSNNPDLRVQYSNFADIPILVDDIKEILLNLDNIDAFILNPLNQNDFPIETIEFLKTFNCPIYLSIQGFLRVPDRKNEVNGNYPILLEKSEHLGEIFNCVDGLFLDENEAKLIFNKEMVNIKEIVVTNASLGSRIILSDLNKEFKINAIKPKEFKDSTGCGDTYMAAYITKRIRGKSPIDAGNFASSIASKKIESIGPYKK